MNEKFLKFRDEYPNFIYNNYEFIDNQDNYEIHYNFTIPNLEDFNPKIIIPKKIVSRKSIDLNFIEQIVFHLGMVEAISYFKCACPPNFIINCGSLNEEQIKWYKKLYFNSLGEFFYRNNIVTDIDTLVNFQNNGPEKKSKRISFESSGNLIPVGGGKDSCVTMEILSNENSNACFLMNAKDPMLECAKVAGYTSDNIYCVERVFDREKIVKLNNLGYLNGHTPLSAVIAFLSYLVAYLSGKKNIVLSNESSANESYVKGKNINHQYSKSYEFEYDFYQFTTTYFSDSIKYFSLLRPLSELQIAYIFSRLKGFHPVFKSCNLGSKNKKWTWCLDCSKCLFIYLVLSPFLSEEELLDIFGENLLNKTELQADFSGLIGEAENKPFECVGTYDDVNYCVNKTIKKYLTANKELPILLKYYYNKYGINNIDDSILKNYNENNNLGECYDNLVRSMITNNNI